MRARRSRLALVLLGDRLVAASVSRHRTETFIVHAEQPAEALRAELNSRRIDAKYVALGLSRAAVTVKPIDLPTVGGEIREMVRFELDRHLPFPAEDAPFDFVSLPPTSVPNGDTPAAQVLVLAADRRVVDSALRIAQEAKLRPRSVTVAAHDLLWLVQPPASRRVVWLHRVGDATDLLFLAGRRLVLSRRVTTTDDAAIAEEIRRSFALARWRTCDAVWASGDVVPPGGPTASPLADLDVPVTEPPFTPGMKRRLAGIEHETRGAAMLALGVAAGRRGRPLDLIPPALRPRRVTRSQGVTMAVLAATVVLSLAALLVPGHVEQRRLDTVNASITRLDGDVRNVERSARDLERKKKLAATIESLPSSGIRPLPVLRELTDLMPNDAWLTTLSFDAKGVEMTGQAAAASSLIPALENSQRFQRVEFASPVTRGREKEQFRIQAGWETPPGRVITAALAAPPPPPAAPPTPPAVSTPARATAPPVVPSPTPGAPPVPAAADTRRPAAAPARPVDGAR